MSCLKHGHHTGCAGGSDIGGFDSQPVRRCLIPGVISELHHGFPQFPAQLFTCLFEKSQCHFTPAHGEPVVLNPGNRICKIVNRIIRSRAGAMPAGVAHGHFPGCISFFSGLNEINHRLTTGIEVSTTRIGVQGELGPGKIFPFKRKHPGCQHPGFLVTGKGNNQIPVGYKALFLQADKCGCKLGHTKFVVNCAATVKIDIICRQFKRWTFPVRCQRLNDIHMPQQ